MSTKSKQVDVKQIKSNNKKSKERVFNCDEVNPDDLPVILDAEIDKRTLVGHHLESFNSFTSQGISQIITQLFKVEHAMKNERDKTPEDQEIESISFVVRFTDVQIARPTMANYYSGIAEELLPNRARLNKLNYSSNLSVDAKITATAYLRDGSEPRVRTDEIKGYRIASIPAMVGSRICHTYDMTRAIKKAVGEDPNDLGGYFILKGTEWSIDMIESRTFNSPHIFRNVGHEKEITRLEFISKPGDAFENSSQLIMKYVQNGNIYMIFDSIKYFSMDIPFYIIFRLMGMTTDQEICDNIIYGYGSPDETDIVTDHMFQILEYALRAPDATFGAARNMCDQGHLLEFFARQTAMFTNFGNAELDDRTIKYMSASIVSLMDKWVLPHIGSTPDMRHTKLRYLGYLIHKMLLVEMQVVESTDRDSLKNKRIHAAGYSYAKSFKRDFNLAIVQPVKKRFRRDFKNIPFSQIQLIQAFTSAIDAPALEKAIIQAIVTGDKEITIRQRQVANRIASEMINRKNQLNFIATLRVIRVPTTSASKQDERADLMRRVHPSYNRSICLIQSADTGTPVGLVKQMALGSSISGASSSELLKMKLLTDPDIIQLRRIFPNQIHNMNLTRIIVNGDWIGCTSNAPLIWYRYRELRRGIKFIDFNTPVSAYAASAVNSADAAALAAKAEIDPFTTIHWDTDGNEIQFWVDPGRQLFPILVVRNNGELDPYGRSLFGSSYDPFKGTNFQQDIMLSQSDISKLLRKEITIDDLHERGIIDYLSPEEMLNAYICPDLHTLRKRSRDHMFQYTHCEIPQGLFGIPALTCPDAQHNQLPRITFQTNQTKQTCGLYALNWPYRVDKHAFLQYYCEIPIIKTLANKYVYPNGVNASVAVMSYSGFNQEDSLLENVAAAQRGFVKGISFGFVQGELDKDEHFGNPDTVHTIDIKNHANYSKLVNGFPKRGTKITNNDVIIGRYIELQKPTDRRLYKDTSIVYPNREPAVIEGVVRARDQDGVDVARVRYSAVRELGIGDKFCLTPDHEVLTNIGWVPVNLLSNHILATINIENGQLEYKPMSELHSFNVNEENMYSINGTYINLTTTMNHKHVISTNKNTFELKNAEDIINTKVWFKKNCVNIMPDLNILKIPITRSNDTVWEFTSDSETYNINYWIEFLGLWLAEGHVDKSGSIRMATHKQKVKNKLDVIMPKINLTKLIFNGDNNTWYIRAIDGNCVALARYLKNSCYKLPTNTKKYIAGYKCLPEFVWSLSKYQCQLLINSMMMGDGNTNTPQSKKGEEYYSSSYQLINDFQRLSLHAGWSSDIVLKRKSGETLNIKNVKTTRNFNAYRASIIKNEKNLPCSANSDIKTIKYTGMVYCPEVENHTFYVRNSNNVRQSGVWTGNSSRAGRQFWPESFRNERLVFLRLIYQPKKSHIPFCGKPLRALTTTFIWETI